MNTDNDQKAPFDITLYPKEVYTTGKGETKERYIVPDDTFEKYLKELPTGTRNQSKTKVASCGGFLNTLGANPEYDKEIQKAGADALNAKLAQRRTFKDQIDIVLANKDKNTEKSGVESVVISMYERALAGDVKAAQFLRDTAGEKPSDTLDLNANVMTEADKALIEKLKSRLGTE